MNIWKKILFTSALALTLTATAQSAQAKDEAGNFVVVLDPGHDYIHAGCSYFGEKEGLLNLEIAKACQDELSQYSNVKVYLTREDNECPFGGSARNCLIERAAYAKSLNADFLVSLHLNSNDQVNSVTGAEGYYANTNYISEFASQGESMCNNILSELSKLGINNRGAKMNGVATESENLYEDGSYGDYYGIIRNSKMRRIPAVIIENAFLNSSSDYYNFLDTSDKLKAIGQADARGIASYYNLSKVPADFTGMMEVNGIWRYYRDGQLVADYTGMAENSYGWWYYKDGNLDWNYTGMAENDYGWWYYVDGRLDWNYTGMAENDYGWWYYVDGRLDWNYTGMAENDYGWWYYVDGRLDWNYTGIGHNANGWWYYKDGRLDWNYTGTIVVDGVQYNVHNGNVEKQ